MVRAWLCGFKKTTNCSSQVPKVYNSRERKDSGHCGGCQKGHCHEHSNLVAHCWFLPHLGQRIHNISCDNDLMKAITAVTKTSSLTPNSSLLVSGELLSLLPLVAEVSAVTVVAIAVTGVNVTNKGAVEGLIVAVEVGTMRVLRCSRQVSIQDNDGLLLLLLPLFFDDSYQIFNISIFSSRNLFTFLIIFCSMIL